MVILINGVRVLRSTWGAFARTIRPSAVARAGLAKLKTPSGVFALGLTSAEALIIIDEVFVTDKDLVPSEVEDIIRQIGYLTFAGAIGLGLKRSAVSMFKRKSVSNVNAGPDLMKGFAINSLRAAPVGMRQRYAQAPYLVFKEPASLRMWAARVKTVVGPLSDVSSRTAAYIKTYDRKARTWVVSNLAGNTLFALSVNGLAFAKQSDFLKRAVIGGGSVEATKWMFPEDGEFPPDTLTVVGDVLNSIGAVIYPEEMSDYDMFHSSIFNSTLVDLIDDPKFYIQRLVSVDVSFAYASTLYHAEVSRLLSIEPFNHTIEIVDDADADSFDEERDEEGSADIIAENNNNGSEASSAPSDTTNLLGG